MKLRRKIREADRELYKLGKKIEIIDKLNWSTPVKDRFFKKWNKGEKSLPKITYKNLNLSRQKETLQLIMKAADKKHPLENIVYETASSYLNALRMVEARGTKRFSTLSKKLYGSPDDYFDEKTVTTARAAAFYLSASKKFNHVFKATEADYCLRPEYVAQCIARAAKNTFKDKSIVIKVDPKLAAKATASINRIRVRAGTCFARHDIDQLINHELMVHTLTLLNGRVQRLKCLGLNSPRTTQTQEGLAVFSEFITNSIDMHRLKRISARVQAVHMGLNGANFLEVFEFFLNQDQSQRESFYSAMRVFRGGKVEGDVVFTKDIVYLRGFIEVHRFFLKSLKDDKFMFPSYLCSGRLQTKDIEIVEEYFENSYLKLPQYEPGWLKNRSTLLAFLLSSSMMNRLGLSKV